MRISFVPALRFVTMWFAVIAVLLGTIAGAATRARAQEDENHPPYKRPPLIINFMLGGGATVPLADSGKPSGMGQFGGKAYFALSPVWMLGTGLSFRISDFAFHYLYGKPGFVPDDYTDHDLADAITIPVTANMWLGRRSWMSAYAGASLDLTMGNYKPAYGPATIYAVAGIAGLDKKNINYDLGIEYPLGNSYTSPTYRVERKTPLVARLLIGYRLYTGKPTESMDY